MTLRYMRALVEWLLLPVSDSNNTDVSPWPARANQREPLDGVIDEHMRAVLTILEKANYTGFGAQTSGKRHARPLIELGTPTTTPFAALLMPTGPY